MKDIPGLILFVDFEKAFDTLEWSFVENVFKRYNYGPSLLAWIKFSIKIFKAVFITMDGLRSSLA